MSLLFNFSPVSLFLVHSPTFLAITEAGSTVTGQSTLLTTNNRTNDPEFGLGALYLDRTEFTVRGGFAEAGGNVGRIVKFTGTYENLQTFGDNILCVAPP